MSQRVADGRQQNVAARLVRLWFQGEPDVVLLLAHVVAQDVQRLAVAVQRGRHVLAAPDSAPSRPPHST